ncbi:MULTISPECIES: glutathione binding-like protein [unclassified Prochlorococcus]|uniref:glutathione binding-like protein n=1 Tax=unclassified Prochlorococcus TaxID=2627481 RepID=UPI00056735F4|nr:MULTISPECIES: glutathione S-transferase family protein [unclassified Prochlorococcus]
MSIPPAIVAAARNGWKWQWNKLMNGLAPADHSGNYKRKPSQARNSTPPTREELLHRTQSELPVLIIGRSCPWAQRTWIIYELRNLKNNLNLLIAWADHKEGLWKISPPWKGYKTLLEIYKFCDSPPTYRATVPVLIDPKPANKTNPLLVGNESAQLLETLNEWPVDNGAPNFYPKDLQPEINAWQEAIQESVNNGVYKCGFARSQVAYEKASEELFHSLKNIEESLSIKGPWLCGDKLTLADIRLFPTIIRWESVYSPLFSCSQEFLSSFPKLIAWRKRFYNLPRVSKTCNAFHWRNDYFGALFPLNPSNIIPKGPKIEEIV